MVVGLGLLSTVESLWAYILYFGVIIGLGESLLLLPMAAVLPRWFVRRQGLAQGIAATGYAIGPIVFLPLMNHLIESIGWRQSFLVFALIVGSLIPIALLLCRGYPEEVGQYPDGAAFPAEATQGQSVFGQEMENPGPTLRQALHSMSFWALTTSFFFGVVSYNILLVHQLPRATVVGVDKSLSVSLFGMAGFFTFVGVSSCLLFGDSQPHQRTTACTADECLHWGLLILSLVLQTSAADTTKPEPPQSM